MNASRSVVSRFVVGLLTGALALVGAVGVTTIGTAPATADTIPPAGTPATVSADRLKTVQIDGVVWEQAIVGDMVYVGGDFATARPADSAPETNTVTRSNLLRYSLSTGVLDDSWNPGANAPVRAVTASPDGSRVYIGGNFTSVAGVSRYRIAAFDTATGALITGFNAVTNSQVRAIAATDTTIFVGGIFSVASGQPRTRLAAFSAATGAILPWNPTADNGTVSAIAVSPNGSVVVAGGNFTSFNGSTSNGFGLGRMDGVTGATLPFPANSVIRNGGDNGSILNLDSDGQNVYGVGYTLGRVGGTLEGTFAASWATGELTWVLDCHGDSYAVYAGAEVVYSASHSHYCGNVRAAPQIDPVNGVRAWVFRRAAAMTKAATQLVGRENLGYTNYEGMPAPTRLNWYPNFDVGSYTGQNQGPWAVTGNANYVVMGGEFLHVNGTRQQGLVRFAVRAIAPNKEGPQYTGADFTPRLRSVGQGAVRISWPANADYDNEDLTYQVIRNGDTAHPAYLGVRQSQDWDRPWMGFTDTGLAQGATYDYRVIASDPFGNAVTSPTQSVTVDGSGALSAYASAVMADGVSYYWRLGDGGSTAVDSGSGNNAATGSALTRGVAGAIAGDANTAVTLTNSANSRIVVSEREQDRNTVSVEAWIRTTSTQGGRIVGFGDSASLTGNSTLRDRQLYMDNAGRLLFGVSPGQNRAVSSATRYNDGQWHHVVGTLGADGVNLYVDGARVASRADWRTGRNVAGFWRIGGDNLSGWASDPASDNFAGSIDEVAIYPIVLSPATIAAHTAFGGGGTPNASPVAAFSTASGALEITVNGSSSSDPDGSVASHAWTFGDGGTGTGATASHTYAAAGTYAVTLTVTDNRGATGVATQQVNITALPGTVDALERYVTRVYDDLFNRVPDAQGMATWTNALASGTPRVAVANSITYSTEYRSGLIRGSYVKYLGRDAEPAGLANWLDQMGRGMTIQQMEGGFLASQEYYNRVAGDDAAWIRKLYDNVLGGRVPAQSEVDYWLPRVGASGGRYGVAMGFLLSTEHLTAVMDGYYHDLLGRSIDPSGRATWVSQIQAGGRVEAVIGGIIASEEYFAGQ